MLKPCKTLEEFVKKYDKDLERILCKSFRKYINIEDLPEIKNDVYAHLLEKKFFQTYDPSKAKFSTYLYTYLFKFLKSKKVKNDKDPTTYAMCIDTPLFEDSDTSLIEIRDFTSDDQQPTDIFCEIQLDNKIRALVKDKHAFQINNPYRHGTLEYQAWSLLLEPKTIDDMEDYVAKNFNFAMENPYHSKKEDIKHIIWNSFWKNWQTKVPICSETLNWSNVAGVRKVIIDPKNLPADEFKLYTTILTSKNISYMELMAQGFGIETLNSLFKKGYVEEIIHNDRRKNNHFYVAITCSYFSFNFARNIAWYMIHLMREHHPELIEFDKGLYYLNTKSDINYKVLQMILNGKTKKQITNTLNISSGALNEARDSMLRDIRKIIDL
jgi:hypothetical protein